MDSQTGPESIGLSYLNALEYCPRRFYYEFVQGDMLRNEFVLEGTLLHERVDQPGRATGAEGETELRHVYLYSERLKLSGFADLIEQADGQFVPVEYKHGRQGRWLNDHVQLCAQALCLEEQMPGLPPILAGYIFYWGSRRRVRVEFTPELRARTLALIEKAFGLAVETLPPPPLEGKLAARCADCSLEPLCLPAEVKLLRARPAELNLAAFQE